VALLDFEENGSTGVPNWVEENITGVVVANEAISK
jgi:hypothetical protein